MIVHEFAVAEIPFVCNPYLIFPNIIGCFPMLILIITWIQLGYSRSHVVSQLKKSRTNPSVTYGELVAISPEKPALYPKVSVIMAVKGIHHASVENWENCIRADYNGTCEFIFTVEDVSDPAYSALSKMIKDNHYQKPVRVIVAGFSFHCSQKLQNLLQAMKSAASDSKYVLVLDDDIAIHPDTINTLVRSLESDPKSFCACGYTLDLPSHSGSIASFCTFIYRCGAIVGYIEKYTHFVWGGCLLLRKLDLDQNTYNLIDMWRDGGYSDDMILSILCRQEGRLVSSPLTCIFPNVLDRNMKFTSYLNFVRRQGFNILTYASKYHQLVNISLALVNYGVLLMNSIPMLLSLMQITDFFYNAFMVFPSPLENPNISLQCQTNTAMAFLMLAIYIISLMAMRYAVNVLVDMCRELSPGRKLDAQIDWLKVGLCYYVHVFSALYVNIINLVSNRIVWSGIRYTIKNGRVVKVERNFESSPMGDAEGHTARVESLRSALTKDAHANFATKRMMQMDTNTKATNQGIKGKLFHTTKSFWRRLLPECYNKD